MDLHLYPTTLSRDRAMRESTRAQGLLFDHRYFTYAELSERLFRSERLAGATDRASRPDRFRAPQPHGIVGGDPIARSGGSSIAA